VLASFGVPALVLALVASSPACRSGADPARVAGTVQPAGAMFPPLDRYGPGLQAVWRDLDAGLAALPTAEVEAVWDAAAVIHRAEFMGEVEADQALDALERLALQWTERWGAASWMAVGWAGVRAFESSLREVLDAAAAGDAAALPTAHRLPDGEAGRQLVDRGGALAAEGLRAGLWDERGRLRVPPEVVRAIYLLRWASLVASVHTPEELLPPGVHRIHARWRIEQGSHLPLERRRELARQYADQYAEDEETPGLEQTLLLLGQP
jgi:hypothetical protein